MKSSTNYNKQNLEDLVRQEKIYLPNISVEQRLKGHEEGRSAHNKNFTEFGKNNNITVEEILPNVQASNRWLFKKGDKEISVFLDKYNSLGNHGGAPYFELYPNIENDISRYKESESEAMLEEINTILFESTQFVFTLLLDNKRISSIETTEDNKEQALEIIYQLAVDLSEHTGLQYTVLKEPVLDVNSEYNTKNLNTLLNLEYGDDYAENYTIHLDKRQKYNEVFSNFADYHGLIMTEQLPIGYVFNRWKFAKKDAPDTSITVTLDDASVTKRGDDTIFFIMVENKKFTVDVEDFPSMLVKIKDVLLSTKKEEPKKEGHSPEFLKVMQSINLL